MTKPLITLGVRHWDHLTPLALGDVELESFTLDLVRSDRTPDLRSRSDLDGGETSLSRVVLGRERGDTSLFALPAFVLSAFRHRCILVRQDSDVEELGQLRGRRIGLTGWPDTGNTWTRALLRAAGVSVADVDWVVGPLTASEKPAGRIGPFGAPDNVGEAADGQSLVELLVSREVDAVLTPTMPPGFHEPGSGIRRLLRDYRSAEEQYFAVTGFVPGIHVVTLRRELVEQYPELPPQLVDGLRRSHRLWMDRRVEAVDTTPWLLDEVEAMARTVGLRWSPYDGSTTELMMEALGVELHAQGLSSDPQHARHVFSSFASLSGRAA